MPHTSLDNHIETAYPSLTTHSDYADFCKFGSPQNFLTRQYGTGGEIDQSDVRHYTHSQRAFANHSMKCLIGLNKDFQSKNMDKEAFERLYNRIADDRAKILLETPDSYIDEAVKNIAYARAAGDEEAESFMLKKYQGILSSISNAHVEGMTEEFSKLFYKTAAEMGETGTVISDNAKYSKYAGIENNQHPLSFFNLKMSLGIGLKRSDIHNYLGELKMDEDNNMTHIMGSYKFRRNSDLRNDKRQSQR